VDTRAAHVILDLSRPRQALGEGPGREAVTRFDEDRNVQVGRSGRGGRLNTEFLIEEGLKGNHLLFSKERIIEAFSRSPGTLEHLLQSRRDAINEAVGTLLSQPNLEEGREYVLGLARDDQHILILLYFHLVDSLLRRRKPVVH